MGSPSHHRYVGSPSHLPRLKGPIYCPLLDGESISPPLCGESIPPPPAERSNLLPLDGEAIPLLLYCINLLSAPDWITVPTFTPYNVGSVYTYVFFNVRICVTSPERWTSKRNTKKLGAVYIYSVASPSVRCSTDLSTWQFVYLSLQCGGSTIGSTTEQ